MGLPREPDAVRLVASQLDLLEGGQLLVDLHPVGSVSCVDGVGILASQELCVVVADNRRWTWIQRLLSHCPCLLCRSARETRCPVVGGAVAKQGGLPRDFILDLNWPACTLPYKSAWVDRAFATYNSVVPTPKLEAALGSAWSRSMIMIWGYIGG